MKDNISKEEKRIDLSNLISLLEEKKFFFMEPKRNKIIAYSFTFFLLLFLGVAFNMEIIAAFFSVFPLTYILGAKGVKFYLPLVLLASCVMIIFTGTFSSFWFIVHLIFPAIIYIGIVKRHSKISLLLFISSLLFLVLALLFMFMIHFGYISFSQQDVSNFINSYIEQMMAIQPTIDKDGYTLVLETMVRSFPVTLYFFLLLYSLLLLKYTLIMLSKEGVIIPSFPKFASMTIKPRVAITFVVLSFIAYLISLIYSDNNNAYIVLIVNNFLSIFSWIFVFNGMCTLFYFAENKQGKTFLKAIIVVIMLAIPSIFELIGFADSILKIREYNEIRKRR